MAGPRDAYGLEISAASATAADHYREGIERLLSSNAGAEECLAAAIAVDEGFALAHAATALALLPRGLIPEAKAAAQRASDLSGGLTPRERGHVLAVARVANADALTALGALRAHLAEFPRDALILRQAMTMILFSGGQTKKEDALALLNQVESHYGDEWFFLATSALTYQDLHLFDEARRRAERALALYPRAANGAHSLAHVYFETDRDDEGAAFLAKWLAGYDRRAPLYCHNHWHLALFELSRGHYRRVMDIYDHEIRPLLHETRNSLYDCVALLWRYQIYGCATGPLDWPDLSARAAELTVKPGFAFNDVHAAMAFAAAGDDQAIGRLIDGLHGLDAQGHPSAGTVVLPIVQGIAAFGRGDYAEAVRLIDPVFDRIVGVGGSNAQREVLEDTLIEACLRAGRFDRAEALLRDRLGRRPRARDFFWLGRAQAGTGRSEAARASRDEARSRWPTADSDGIELQALASLA